MTLIENAENTGFGPACNAEPAGAGALPAVPQPRCRPDARRDGRDGGGVSAIMRRWASSAPASSSPAAICRNPVRAFATNAGLTHPHGRGEPDPLAPEHAATRDVGYVSGAVLMIERALFEELGGFDRSSPRLLRGHRPLPALPSGRAEGAVQPRATAIHNENATSAKREEVEALLDRNRAASSTAPAKTCSRRGRSQGRAPASTTTHGGCGALRRRPGAPSRSRAPACRGPTPSSTPWRSSASP